MYLEDTDDIISDGLSLIVWHGDDDMKNNSQHLYILIK